MSGREALRSFEFIAGEALRFRTMADQKKAELAERFPDGGFEFRKRSYAREESFAWSHFFQAIENLRNVVRKAK